jgi:cell shape-determining protein MreD
MKTNTKKRTFLQVCLILLLAEMLTGCADTVQINTGMTEVGFWHGLWHGMILPFAWFVSLFSDSTSIYAVYNNGG